MESKVQKQIIDWLKINKVYVIKTRVAPGVPTGCPDIIGLYENRWLAIEVKAAHDSPFRPGQKATLNYLGEGNPFVYVAHPENWPDIKKELIENFF